MDQQTNQPSTAAQPGGTQTPATPVPQQAAPQPVVQPVAPQQQDVKEAFDINKLLRTALQYNASDVYLSVGIKPTLRINGSLYPVDSHPVLSKQIAEKYILQIMNKNQQQEFMQNMDLDFSMEISGIGRFRANIFVQNKGIGAATWV